MQILNMTLFFAARAKSAVMATCVHISALITIVRIISSSGSSGGGGGAPQQTKGTCRCS